MSAPESVDLTAAAAVYLNHQGECCDTGDQGAQEALQALWKALTGLDGIEAREAAEALASDMPPTIAHVPPC